MPRPENDNLKREPTGPLRRADQVVVATCVLAGLLALAGYWGQRSMTGSRLIDIDTAQPLHSQFQVDINSAEWPEFAQLPRIGETLARRIVEERQQGGAFVDYADLQRRVRGIGPVSIERMEPYLLPMVDAANVASGGNADGAFDSKDRGGS